MTTAHVYLARAAQLRAEARYHVGFARARLLSRAESCERLAGSAARLTNSEPLTTLSRDRRLVEVP